ncbi:MAG TPA: NEW3 domain-containing protein [Beijerinckiaceae bacterium]|nr:NEW3 domain-containing protein [Beijerinckiaceae bacterium]
MRAPLSAALFLALASAAFAKDAAAVHVQGLWLTTDYPALQLRAGEHASLPLTIYNYGLAPQRTAISMSGAPAAWKPKLEGAGKPVSAAFVDLDGQASLTLNLNIPATAKPGPYKIVLDATGDSAKSELPIAITLAPPLAAKLTATPKFPVLKGSPKSTFDFSVALKNKSAVDQLVNLDAKTPPGFTTTFKEGYGPQELTSIPVKAGASKTISVSVKPAPDAAAGRYPIEVSFSGEHASARTRLTLDVSGQASVSLAGQGGRLSGVAYAGKQQTFPMVLRNQGSAPANDIRLSATPPDGWTVSFDPKTVRRLAPNARQKVTAKVTPSAQAIAGDYMVSMRASGDGVSKSASYRVTVQTSTLWGVTGVAVIGAALLVLVGAVGRYGRR